MYVVELLLQSSSTRVGAHVRPDCCACRRLLNETTCLDEQPLISSSMMLLEGRVTLGSWP
jgi:hypothetical protein